MNCKYCGKADTPVRQVPCPMPFSDCYCEACVQNARDEYEMKEIDRVLSNAKSLAEVDQFQRHLAIVLASELKEARFADKVESALRMARSRFVDVA